MSVDTHNRYACSGSGRRSIKPRIIKLRKMTSEFTPRRYSIFAREIGPRYAMIESASRLAGVRSSESSSRTKFSRMALNSGFVASWTFSFPRNTSAILAHHFLIVFFISATSVSHSPASIFKTDSIFLNEIGSPWIKRMLQVQLVFCS